MLIEYTPIAQKITMAGNIQRYGTVNSLTHRPISGRFRITSIALPIHIDTIRPQNNSGLRVITIGPGWMLWIIIAPNISAITAPVGMPIVSSGMKHVCAAALLAASGPATPRMLPVPSGNSPLRSGTFFSTA